MKNMLCASPGIYPEKIYLVRRRSVYQISVLSTQFALTL